MKAGGTACRCKGWSSCHQHLYLREVFAYVEATEPLSGYTPCPRLRFCNTVTWLSTEVKTAGIK